MPVTGDLLVQIIAAGIEDGDVAGNGLQMLPANLVVFPPGFTLVVVADKGPRLFDFADYFRIILDNVGNYGFAVVIFELLAFHELIQDGCFIGIVSGPLAVLDGIAQLVHGRAPERIAQVADQVVTGIAKLIDGRNHQLAADVLDLLDGALRFLEPGTYFLKGLLLIRGRQTHLPSKKPFLPFVQVFLCGERPALYQDVAGSCQTGRLAAQGPPFLISVDGRWRWYERKKIFEL